MSERTPGEMDAATSEQSKGDLHGPNRTQVHERIPSQPPPSAKPPQPMGVLEILAESTWGSGRFAAQFAVREGRPGTA